MNKKQGFVLPTVLLFIQIFALMGMSALEQVVIEQKLISEQQSRRLLLNAAEKRLHQLESSLAVTREFCRLPQISPDQFASRPLSWWTTYSCSEEASNYRFYYTVENLGRDPCAQIPGGGLGAAYYRLTLLTVENGEGRRVMLQSTVLAAGPTEEHCDSHSHSVDLGPQSWLELI